jgi:5-methylcytosine-specific restriction endonuclease McrA
MADAHFTFKCEVCGNDYVPSLNGDGTPRKVKYHICSSRCKQRLKYKKWVPLTITCTVCSKQFVQTFAQQVLYCSRKCSSRAWQKRNPEQHKANCDKYALSRKPKTKPKKTEQQLLADVRKKLLRSIKMLMREMIKQEKKTLDALRPCIKCNNPIGPGFTKSKRLCVACEALATKEAYKAYRKSEAHKERRRADKKYRRAIERGVEAERFKPIEIFMRDGWRCQICGVSTPQTRRGTYHKNAPELDHIIPLSKGGKHTKTNVQCACRSCNGKKSDKVVVGQMGLFAA